MSAPRVRWRPGWQVCVDRLVQELGEVDPGAELVEVDPTIHGPKGHWRGASVAGVELIMRGLEELAHTCGRCGHMSEERIHWCDEYESRRVTGTPREQARARRPLTPEQEAEIGKLRAEMEREMEEGDDDE